MRPWGASLTGRGEAEQLDAQLVSSDFFSLLGVKPLLGRNFVRGEDEIGAAPAVLVSAELWRRKLGAAPDVLGQSLTLDGRDYPIVGVVSASFGLQIPGFTRADVYVPVGQWSNPWLRRRSVGMMMHGIGRLRPGVTIQQARADLQRITRNLAAAYPEADQGIGATLVPLADEVVRDVRPFLLMLLGAVGQGARMALLGAAAGLAAALGLTRLMGHLLFGVSATDPLTFAGVVAVLISVTLAACYVPASRAMRIDPALALRRE